MFAFFRCVAEAVAENGVRGLAEMVPGGAFAYAVAQSTWAKYRQRNREQEIRSDIRQLAAASFEQVREAAVEAAREVTAAGQPPSTDLELYLSQIPAALKQSLKRPDDPTGTTVPPAFRLGSADDLLRLLPPRPPQFRPGDPLPGKPGWSLVRPLGVGGFGEVWLAQHLQVAALAAAVKFFGRTVDQTLNLQHETGIVGRVMAAGRHPNVVPLLDAHLDGAAPWLMYEYVPGGDLADLIRGWQQKTPAERVGLVLGALQDLAGAVGHFHRLSPPVVHRDLKPANVLLRVESRKVESRKVGSHPSGQADVTTLRPDDLRLMVTDFGIGGVAARQSLREEDRGTVTQGGRMLAQLRGSYTPLYASPQQRAGADPDPRDDVHALGVIAYQMLTGKLDAAPGPKFERELRAVGTPGELIELIGDCVDALLGQGPAEGAALAARVEEIANSRAAGSGQSSSTPAATPPRPVSPPPFDSRDGLVSQQQPGVGAARVGPHGIVFRLIPEGKVTIGASDGDTAARANERPRRAVTIPRPFWVAAFPLTNAVVRRFLDEAARPEEVRLVRDRSFAPAARTGAHPDVPATGISATDATVLCAWLGRSDGRAYRLPTEAEWEYLARAGATGPHWWAGPTAPLVTALSAADPARANAWGLIDVLGNVAEWTSSGYGELTTDAPLKPAAKLAAHTRVIRGGSWRDRPDRLRLSFRDSMAEAARKDDVGVRVVCDLDPEPDRT
jgi:formylglycine-generating enzyme required for sulfatase activity